jgi:hypothetical protein
MDHDLFEALLLPFICNVLRKFVIAHRSSDVGLLGENTMLAALLIRAGYGFKLGFYLSLTHCGCGSEAEDGLSVSRADPTKERNNKADRKFGIHGFAAPC